MEPKVIWEGEVQEIDLYYGYFRVVVRRVEIEVAGMPLHELIIEQSSHDALGKEAWVDLYDDDDIEAANAVLCRALLSQMKLDELATTDAP